MLPCNRSWLDVSTVHVLCQVHPTWTFVWRKWAPGKCCYQRHVWNATTQLSFIILHSFELSRWHQRACLLPTHHIAGRKVVCRFSSEFRLNSGLFCVFIIIILVFCIIKYITYIELLNLNLTQGKISFWLNSSLFGAGVTSRASNKFLHCFY